MTDIAVLAHDQTTLLVPFLPYLVKAGEGAAEVTGKKLVEGTGTAAKAIWNRLKPKVEATPLALEAAQDLAANPTDNDLQATLRSQLKKLLSEDQSFATEVEQLFNKAKEVGGSQVSATHGGIAFGHTAIDNTIVGTVHGDFVIGSKQK